MDKKGANAAWFFFGIAATFVFLAIADRAVLLSLRNNFGWTAIGSIGTFGAVAVALYQISARDSADERLREERNLLGLKMLREPVQALSSSFESFSLDMKPTLESIKNGLEDPRYRLKSMFEEPSGLESDLELAIDIAQTLCDRTNAIDFTLVNANLDYFLSSKPEVNELTERLFLVFQHVSGIKTKADVLLGTPSNRIKTRIMLLKHLDCLLDRSKDDLDRLNQLVSNLCKK